MGLGRVPEPGYDCSLAGVPRSRIGQRTLPQTLRAWCVGLRRRCRIDILFDFPSLLSFMDVFISRSIVSKSGPSQPEFRRAA